MKKVALTLFVIILLLNLSKAQDANQTTNNASLKVTTDIVSSYVWRGVVSSMSPNFQPTLAIVKGPFEIGFWGSYDFVGQYKESDLYMTYSLPVGLAITLTDYYWTSPGSQRYFDFKSNETGHILEALISYKGPESFPLGFTVGTMLWGNDHKYDPMTYTYDTKQYYSTYIEVNYSFKIGGQNLDALVGMTPSDGYYGDGYGGIGGFNVINIGLTGNRKIKISPTFELPVKVSLITNPQSEMTFLIVGITL